MCDIVSVAVSIKRAPLQKYCSRACKDKAHGLIYRKENHPLWKGEDAAIRRFKQYYDRVHYWVEKNYNRPQVCTNCGKTNGIFDWANISGDYKKEIEDWTRLCRQCHSSYDMGRIKLQFLFSYLDYPQAPIAKKDFTGQN